MAIHNLETEVLQELVTLLLDGIDEYMCVTLESIKNFRVHGYMLRNDVVHLAAGHFK